MKRFLLTIAGIVLASVMSSGCGPGDSTASNSGDDSHGHDHGEHGHEHGHDHGSKENAEAKSFADAVLDVEKLASDVKTAFAASDLEAADGPVHEIGHMLEDLTAAAEKESLSPADQETVKGAVDELFSCFGALDERVHGGESSGKSYDDVAEEIDAAIAKLKAVGKPGED